MTLTLAEANSIISVAIAKAQELDIQVNVSVCDAGGRLVAFNRMDGAIWAGGLGSQGKAVTSAAFGRPSRLLEARADKPTVRGIVAAAGGTMIPGQGGLPIFRDGVLEGGCGVGGGTGEQDEDCAKAGLEALAFGWRSRPEHG